MDRAFHTRGARDATRDVLGKATALIVVKNFFEVMHAAEVTACTLAVAVALDLDHVNQILGSIGTWFVGEHAGEAQSVFVKSPAVHRLQIHHGVLDVIVDFEAIVHIAHAK